MEGKKMKHLVECFQKNQGIRGVTFYDDTHCTFLTWKEVFKFIDSLPPRTGGDEFADKLAESLSNYDPNQEFLAVHQSGDSVSVELYSHPKLCSDEEGRTLW
jgi:hypothetical protein